MHLPRVYPILDTALLAQRGMPLALAARILLDGGIRLLQIRHKGSWDRWTFAAAEEIAQQSQAAGATLVINDRADIARMIEALAVHVGQDDLPVELVRAQSNPGTVIGLSTHDAAQMEAASPEADYVALGPIFATQSKENPSAVVGLNQLRLWRPLTRRPLVAIGGITLERAPDVLAAGADSVAIIGALFADPLTPESLQERTQAWLPLN